MSSSILSPAQRALLDRLSRSEFARDFYLTGGTALAEAYLHHRYSEDLDFFTDDARKMAERTPVLERCARDLGASVRVSRTHDTFRECFLDLGGESLKIHLAVDTAARIEPVRRDHPIGFPVDHELDIAANKISALFDRSTERDYVDVYFLHRELVPLERALEVVPRKHVGIEGYWLAQAFQRASTIDLLPRMIKPLSIEELKSFFLGEAKKLTAGLRPDSR